MECSQLISALLRPLKRASLAMLKEELNRLLEGSGPVA